jgi:hypothetical protein
MRVEEFNALPLEARQYIIKQQGCLSCGKAQDLDTLYKKYQIMTKQKLFTLRVGAVSYKTEDGKSGVLYPLHSKDSEATIKEKLQKALEVHSVAPGRFSEFNERDIKEFLADVEKPTKPLFGAAKKAADAKAAKVANDLD